MSDNEFLTECETKANEAKALAEKATKGPWVKRHNCGVFDESNACDNNVATVNPARLEYHANVEFINKSIISNPDLAARVLRLVEMVRERDQRIEEMRDDAREATSYREWKSDQ